MFIARTARGAALIALLVCDCVMTATTPRNVSESVWTFTFREPLTQWQYGLPVGNGRIGAQVWGNGEHIYLTLDRSDIWDLRYQPNTSPNYTYKRLRELVRQKRRDLIQSELSADVSPTANTTPSHVSAGRLTLELPTGTTVEDATLDMRAAEVRWKLRVEQRVVWLRVVACTTENVILITLDGVNGWQPKLKHEPLTELAPSLIEKLGYQRATRGATWTTERIPESGAFTTAWQASTMPERWQLLLTITSQKEADSVAAARNVLAHAARMGLEGLNTQHHEWWRERWARSSVRLGDTQFERLWINGIYKLASSSHGSVPVNLQGLWPPDGVLPPWRGDYHCDMNVQETYWPCYNANHLDLGEPLNRWLVRKVAPEAEALTKRFFGVDGLWMSTSYDTEGRLLGGTTNWMTVQYWLGGGPWMAQHLWWHYRYSMDREFLRRDAYPFLKKSLTFFENILEPGADGRLHIPLSTSPEYFSNDLEAWTEDPTVDLALVRNLARWTIAASETLDVDQADRTRWQALLTRLVPYPVNRKSGLMVQPNVEYDRSHRHPMHLFPIFPGEDLTLEGTSQDRALIQASINNWIFRGLGEWSGHAYMNSVPIAARLGRGNMAANFLDIYARAFILPNGFHVNGDYKRLGFSIHAGTPYTVEAECAFPAVVNEMLLQSWGGKLRVFPAVPDQWRDISFENLRAEGALLVSAEMRAGRVTRLSILSEKGGTVRLMWPPGPQAANTRIEERSIEFRPGERKDLTSVLTAPARTSADAN